MFKEKIVINPINSIRFLEGSRAIRGGCFLNWENDVRKRNAGYIKRKLYTRGFRLCLKKIR